MTVAQIDFPICFPLWCYHIQVPMHAVNEDREYISEHDSDSEYHSVNENREYISEHGDDSEYHEINEDIKYIIEED